MTTTRDFNARCERLFGHGWKRRVERALQRDYATVKRWAAGTVDVPDYVFALLELLESLDASLWPTRWKEFVRKNRSPNPRRRAAA